MTHADWCEAETDHPLDCATATELGRLRAFAEACRDESPHTSSLLGREPADSCWHCAAIAALEKPGG